MMKRFNSNRGLTPTELRYPEIPEFTAMVRQYQADAMDKMLEAVWKAYDLLIIEFLSQIDINEAKEELERSITKHFPQRIRQSLTGYESYHVEQEVIEEETRQAAPAQSPAYDIAFIITANPRIMWPLEAKILKTSGAIAKYLAEIRDNYLIGRYAPFSKSAAMMGYLLSGNPEEVVANIERKLDCQLTQYHFKNTKVRPHYISKHQRFFENPKWASGEFECHHLIMMMNQHNL